MIKQALAKVPWWLQAIFVAGLTVMGTLYVDSHEAAKKEQVTQDLRISNLEDRSVKLEAHQSDEHEILAHIQAQVDKLTEWALGHK